MPIPDPIPYYASLAKVLHGPTLALVLTYLEIYHPAPQDSFNPHFSLIDAPICIDGETVARDIGISRRTLQVALNCLGCCWGTEAERCRAARAGREFINQLHSNKRQGHDQVKIYSFTGSRAYTKLQTLAIRRNYPKLASILTIAGFIDQQILCTELVDAQRFERSVLSLPEILARTLPDWGDRRAERWERWRRAEGREPTNLKRMRQATSSLDVVTPRE